MTTTTFTAAEGRAVIAATSAETMGEVRHFAVDVTASRVEAIHISGRRGKAAFLPWEAVQSFGDDVVIAVDEDAAAPADDDRVEAVARGKRTMRGSRVLSTHGVDLGTVADVCFDAETGSLVSIEVDDESIPADRVRSFGSYAVVVTAS